MFGELPKLFDRNFAIGYLLPSAFITALNFWLLYVFNFLSKNLRAEAAHLLTDPNQSKTLITLYGVTTFGLGILLLVLNYPITRLLEGYEDFNPFRLIAGLEKRRFKRLLAKKNALKIQLNALTPESAEYEVLNTRMGQIEMYMITRFPYDMELVLPTAFGNTLRAFETHSLLMYGLDAIPTWHRLLAVIPKDFRELMDGAKAQMDFWMNGWFLTGLFLLEFGGLEVFRPVGHSLGLIIGVVSISSLTIYVFSEMSKQTAGEWGNFVKSAFDMFWPDMLKKLGFKVPKSKQEEEELWNKFSAALVFGLKEYLPERDYESLKPAKETKPKEP